MSKDHSTHASRSQLGPQAGKNTGSDGHPWQDEVVQVVLHASLNSCGPDMGLANCSHCGNKAQINKLATELRQKIYVPLKQRKVCGASIIKKDQVHCIRTIG